MGDRDRLVYRYEAGVPAERELSCPGTEPQGGLADPAVLAALIRHLPGRLRTHRLVTPSTVLR